MKSIRAPFANAAAGASARAFDAHLRAPHPATRPGDGPPFQPIDRCRRYGTLVGSPCFSPGTSAYVHAPRSHLARRSRPRRDRPRALGLGAGCGDRHGGAGRGLFSGRHCLEDGHRAVPQRCRHDRALAARVSPAHAARRLRRQLGDPRVRPSYRRRLGRGLRDGIPAPSAVRPDALGFGT